MKVETETLRLLERGTAEGQLYRLPSGQLERKTYERVNKVLEALGGKWDRKSRAHLFERPIEDVLEQVFVTGVAVNRKQELGFFETPAALARELVALAEIGPDMRVLEPSAGRGAIVRAVLDAVPSARITAVEIDESHHLSLQPLACNWFLEEVLRADFLTTRPIACNWFDRVVMNPPFARQQDIDHVLHAWEWLHPGGILVSVMGASVTFRETRKTYQFRQWAALEAEDYCIRALPEGTFRESGAGASAIVIKARKRGGS